MFYVLVFNNKQTVASSDPDLEVKVVTFDPRSRSYAAILDVKNILYSRN